jgi:hypothetical protein
VKFETECRDCHFAVRDHEEWNGTDVQKGCEFGRIKKYGPRAERIGVNETYVINNALCNYKRTSPVDKAKVVAEGQVRVDVVMVHKPGANHEDFFATAESLLDQAGVKPASINVITLSDEDRVVFSEYLYQNSGGIPYTVETVDPDFFPDPYTGEFAELAWNINEAIRHRSGNYLTVCESGYEYSEDALSFLERELNVEMHDLLLTCPEDGFDGMMVNRNAISHPQINYDLDKLKSVLKGGNP